MDPTGKPWGVAWGKVEDFIGARAMQVRPAWPAQNFAPSQFGVRRRAPAACLLRLPTA
jgi:hypothetical protein